MEETEKWINVDIGISKQVFDKVNYADLEPDFQTSLEVCLAGGIRLPTISINSGTNL
jgi:hypothetical protein